MNALICAPLLDHAGWNANRRLGWWIAVAISAPLCLLLIVGLLWAATHGIGVWGNNSTVVWGFDIANYVWWIGIGNAGTLISALLLLTRQEWRSSISRYAEAMTLFAASIAGLFPIFHLGRPWFFYWLAPTPNPMALWPQWRSPLTWDFWAITSYILFSLLFWYSGLIPDLATLRDRARSPLMRRAYGAFALGWRGSARQWRLQQTLTKVMAGLAVPLVCSVHSIVGLDFAASLEPGWAEALFPPYFVVGAMFSGFAMVVLLSLLLRRGLGLKALITDRHIDAMAKIILAGSIIMGLSYGTEWFMGWYSGEGADRRYLGWVFTGAYAPLLVLMVLFNVAAPQALWSPRVRRRPLVVCAVCLGILIGMWLERVLILWNTLGHDHLPTLWRTFTPTVWDWAVLAGSLGTFALMFLLFVRLIPVISMAEVRASLPQGQANG